MSEAPKCPYCGAKMELLEGELICRGNKAVYRCVPCKANAPLAECETRSEAAALAYEFAIRRAPEPAHPAHKIDIGGDLT